MPPRLTRAVIIEAAFEVLDRVGIDGLTVRALAAQLGVKAPALYWHLDSKQDLLDEMGTEVTRRIRRSLDVAAENASLAEALRAYAIAVREEYLRHRDGARTFSGTRLTDPDLLRSQERTLARWVAQGHSVEQVSDAFAITTAFVVGFVIEEQERAQSTAERYDLAARDAAVGEDHPLTIASGRRIYSDPATRFGQHLDRIIPALVNA